MKINSAACLFFLLRYAAGSSIRGSRALGAIKEEDSANLPEEVSNQGGSAIGIDERVDGDDASGAGDAVQMYASEPTLEHTLEAITFGIGKQVYKDDASGAGDAIQEDFLTPEKANEFSIEDPSGKGDYLQEPIDEPFYSYYASGAGDYVQEDSLESTPENIQVASTFGISKPSYGYDALGNYVQGGILEPMSGNTQEVSPIDINHEGIGYEASDAGDDGQEDLFGRRMLTDYNSGGMTHRALRTTKRPSALKTSAPSGSPTARPTASPSASSTIPSEPITGNATALSNNLARSINWSQGKAATWAWDCDFPHMGDYKQVYNTRGDQCDPLCVADSQCTHFTFNPSGICYLKRGGAFKNDAEELPKGSGVICGIKITPYTRALNAAKWMSDLPDASYLHDLLIPGAHNAIAGPNSASGYTQSHDQYIMGLLNRGYRYFDFRLAQCSPQHYNSFAGANSLCFWHPLGDNLDLNLDQVAWELYRFLQNNPLEVITVKIAIGRPDTSPNGFLQRVEKYFEGHHEWWVHPGVRADMTSPNIRLRDVRGRIVVLWDCDGCEISGWGLNYRSRVNRHGGDGAFFNVDAAYDSYKTRAWQAIWSPGFFEMKSEWTRIVNGTPIPLMIRSTAELMNPKVTNLLFNGGSLVSQKGIISMDFGTDQMINQIVDITRVRQFRWLTPNFIGI